MDNNILKMVWQKFDDISFILLLIVWFSISTFINISFEKSYLNSVIVEQKNDIQSHALLFFDNKKQNTTNINDFIWTLVRHNDINNWNHVQMQLRHVNVFDRRGNNIVSNDYSKTGTGKERLHWSLYAAALSWNVDTYDNWEVITTIKLNSWNKLVVGSELDDRNKLIIWKNHAYSYLFAFLIVMWIYISYRVFFVNKIKKII